MAQDEWAMPARVVADAVRRLRNQQGLSAQQLADRCAHYGVPIHRSVIANLESGRRPIVSIAELLVLARALDTAPILLLAPLTQENVEVSPGHTLPTWEAFRWLSGETRLVDAEDGFRTVTIADDDDPVVLFRSHDRYTELLMGDQAAEDQKVRDILRDSLRLIRSRMRERGLKPPPLPATLSQVDSGVAIDRTRTVEWDAHMAARQARARRDEHGGGS